MSARNIALRRHAYCKIMIGQKDVTKIVEPYLISVQVIDKGAAGDLAPDECHIELDDRDGRLEVPSDSVPIAIWLGWSGEGPRLPPVPPLTGIDSELPWEQTVGMVFRGRVETVESGFARGAGGRRMWIEGKSNNIFAHGKTPYLFSMGEGENVDTSGTKFEPKELGTFPTGPLGPAAQGGGGGGGQKIPLSQFLKAAGKNAGYDVSTSAGIASITRDFWFQNESFHSLMARLGKDMGLKFKIQNNKVKAARGDELLNGATVIDAYWGVNLISWRIKPFIGRPQFDNAKSTWFDSVNGKFRETLRDITGDAPFNQASSIVSLPAMAPNRQVGDQIANGLGQDSLQQRGTGWAIINGDPAALADSICNIVGARQGVDGRYLVSEAEHNYIRSGGYTTRLTLKQPERGKGFPPAWNVTPAPASG